MNQSNSTLWTSKQFVHSYRRLDEEWQIKKELYRELASLIAQHAEGKENALNILDLGGGLGTLGTITELIMGNSGVEAWVVYDLARKMMQVGSAFKDRVPNKLSFIQADLLKPFAFPSNTFDVIVCLNVLYQFADTWHYTHIANEVLRVLKPGGIIIAAGPLPKSANSKIMREEVMLRKRQSNLIFALCSVARDIVTNLSFIADQSQLVKIANKKVPSEWGELYFQATKGQLALTSVAVSQSYAHQVGIWTMTKQESSQ